MSDQDTPETFDAEYVKQLRSEAAKYRSQVKELKTEMEGYKGLEAQISTIRIENEFVRRGITAEPSWVQIQEGEAPSQAVDRFLEKYPQFAGGGTQRTVEEEQTPAAPELPRSMPPKPTNTHHQPLSRDLEDIKKDPVQRQNLTDLYRDLLRSNSNQKD